jgi:ABC-2 type transport system ATP-binding protein
MNAVTQPASRLGWAVRLDALSKTFPGQQQPALHDLRATFAPGRVTGLVGPDGSGKTTLMRIIAGLLEANAGSVVIQEGDRHLSADEVKASLGYMPQRFGLYEDLTVQENLVLNADLRGVPHSVRPSKFDTLLEFTDLRRFVDRYAGKLSGGMKQKLGLACALIAAPSVLLLDEPSVGVDPISRRELWRMVRELAGEGMTVVWSTAYLDEAERCDDVVLMNQGAILFQGEPALFSRRCAGRVFLVRVPGNQKRSALQRFSRAAESVDTLIQGDQLRVVMRDRCSESELRATLRIAPEDGVTTAEPRFEDAYIDAIGGATKEESVLGKVADARTNASDLPMIEAVELTKRFGDFAATDHVNFKIEQGEVFGLLGPNGAGKSTTFKMLCGLLKPTEGSAQVVGIDLASRAGEAKQRLGYMAQKFSMYDVLTVQQNLEFFAGIYGLHGRAQKARVSELVEAFALQKYLKATPPSIPLGFKQRLALACALMHEPDILFLDEPTSGVDPITRREFWSHINAMVEKKITVLVTTHFMEEAEYCDRIGLVYRGRVIALGTPDELKRSVATAELPDPTMEDAFIKLVEASKL